MWSYKTDGGIVSTIIVMTGDNMVSMREKGNKLSLTQNKSYKFAMYTIGAQIQFVHKYTVYMIVDHNQ